MKTIRGNLIIFFITTVVVLLLLGFILNKLYLEDFYVYKNKALFIEAKHRITQAYEKDKKMGKKVMEQIDQIDNINCLVTNENLEIQFVIPKIKENQDQKRLPKEIEIFVIGQKEKLGKKDIYGTVKKEDKQEAKMIMVSTLPGREILILTKAMKGIQESAAIANQFYLIAGVFIITIGSVLIILFSKRITEPIVEMSEVAACMAQLDFEQRIAVDSQDEIGRLGTSINELSEKLSETLDTLQKDIQKKKELVRNMSHELKTPIGIIKGYTEGLHYGLAEDREKRERYYQVIVQECDRMDYIVRELLKLSQMNESSFQLHKNSIQVDALIEEVIERFMPQLQKEKVTIIYKKVAPLEMEVDVQLMEQVLNNFMTNAMNHIDGKREIQITAKKQESNVIIGVFNTGRPIPDKDLRHIWDVFYKVDKARTRGYGGHGIGLSIVKQIAQLHEGVVGVQNKEEGVLFYIEVPSSGNI